MKRLFKYTATLFVLLLLGYTQVFAHIHQDDFSSVTEAKRSHQLQAPVAKTSEIGGDYFTEENKRNLLKAYLEDNTGSDVLYAHVSAEYFFQRLETLSLFAEHFTHLLIFRASLFRILRL